MRRHHLPLLAIILMLPVGTALAQSYADQFYEALNARQSSVARQVLAEWEEASPSDADWHVACFNFYIDQAAVWEGEPDPDNPPQAWNTSVADSGLRVIDHAIGLYADRLDLRFGKIYFLGLLERWESFADEIIRALDHSDRIGHQWLFPNWEGSGEELLSDGIADYQQMMLEQIADQKHLTNADSALVLLMRQVARRTVQVLPADKSAIQTLALTYRLFGDIATADRYLRRIGE